MCLDTYQLLQKSEYINQNQYVSDFYLHVHIIKLRVSINHLPIPGIPYSFVFYSITELYLGFEWLYLLQPKQK